MGFYKFKGLVQDVGTVAAAAEVMGADVEVLKKTLEDYNEVPALILDTSVFLGGMYLR